MTFLLIILTGLCAILLSELLGRGAVVYTRMFGLIGSWAVCCAASGFFVVGRGGGWLDVAAIVLSVTPIMAAWLGFRIHISNSITLEMATFLSPAQAKTHEDLARDYGLEQHSCNRVGILKQGGYLTDDEAEDLTDTPKARLILRAMSMLCGPDGPRSVAAGLAAHESGGAANGP